MISLHVVFDLSKAKIINNRCNIQDQKRFYFGDEGDDVLDEVCDVDRVWRSFRVLVTSPVITVGVNFDARPPHYHSLFIWGSAHSCTSRDIIRKQFCTDNALLFE